MDKEKQYRLIGIVVLALFITLLVFFFFNDSPDYKADGFSEIKAIKPQLKPIVIPTPSPKVKQETQKETAGQYEMLNSLSEPALSASKPSISKTKENTDLKSTSQDITKTVEPKPVIKKPTTTISTKTTNTTKTGQWIIRVASFVVKNNAKNLVIKLKKQDYPVQIIPLVINSKQFYRVVVGPYTNKQMANKIKREIDKSYSVKSMVTR